MKEGKLNKKANSDNLNDYFLDAPIFMYFQNFLSITNSPLFTTTNQHINNLSSTYFIIIINNVSYKIDFSGTAPSSVGEIVVTRILLTFIPLLDNITFFLLTTES